jgi:hypothetical protein
MTSSNISSLEEAIILDDDELFEELPSLKEALEAELNDNENSSSEEEEITTVVETEEEETKITSGTTIVAPSEETEESEETDETPSTQNVDELAKANYEFLVKNNIFTPPEDFEFDGTPEALQQVQEATRQSYANEAFQALWQKMHPDFQQALSYAANGGTSIEEFYNMYKDTPESIANMDLESEDNQRKALRLYYEKTTKYTPDKINKFIERLEKTGDLKVEAEDAIDYLQENLREEQRRFQEQQAQQLREQQEQAEANRAQILDIIKESSSIKDKRKNKIKAFLFNEIQDEQGHKDTMFNTRVRQVFATPEHLVQFADLLSTYDPKSGFDLSRYEERGSTKANIKFQEELEESLAKTQRKLKGAPPTAPNQNVDWSTILKQID